MAGLSDIWEDKALDFLLGTNPAANRWTALYTVAPTDATSGTEVANANAYARTLTTFTASSGGLASNDIVITFPTATGSWGVVTHWAIVTAAGHGAGEIVFYGAFNASRVVGTTDVVAIPIGDLELTAQ